MFLLAIVDRLLKGLFIFCGFGTLTFPMLLGFCRSWAIEVFRLYKVWACFLETGLLPGLGFTEVGLFRYVWTITHQISCDTSPRMFHPSVHVNQVWNLFIVCFLLSTVPTFVIRAAAWLRSR